MRMDRKGHCRGRRGGGKVAFKGREGEGVCEETLGWDRGKWKRDREGKAKGGTNRTKMGEGKGK